VFQIVAQGLFFVQVLYPVAPGTPRNGGEGQALLLQTGLYLQGITFEGIETHTGLKRMQKGFQKGLHI